MRRSPTRKRRSVPPPWRQTPSRPLASPALSSGPVGGLRPRSPIQSANLPHVQPSPLALLKPANPPGPVSAAKAPSQETPQKRRQEPGLSAHFRASSRLTGQAGAEPSQGGQAEKQRGKQASARLQGPGNCAAPDAGSRAGEVGCGANKKNARAFVRVLPGTALFFTCTLPWTRRPLRGGRRRRTAGAGRGVRELPCWGGRRPGRSARIIVSTDAARPPRHWTGRRRTEGGLEARERCGDVMGPLAPGLGRQSNEGWEGPLGGRVAGKVPA